tara:strand:- start:3233 stop:3613 length:381 start_codon:yes stop_codon:yes gene_type:complete
MFTGGGVIGPSKALSPPTFNLTYSDFISILLTALGLILAALAIVIGLIAFRTIGEIKREAVNRVEKQVKEDLPAAINEAVEKAGKEGRLDDALQNALMQFSFGGGAMNYELQPDFEEQSNKEDKID